MFVDQRLAHIEMAVRMAEAAIYRRKRDKQRAEAPLQSPPQRPAARTGGRVRD